MYKCIYTYMYIKNDHDHELYDKAVLSQKLIQNIQKYIIL